MNSPCPSPSAWLGLSLVLSLVLGACATEQPRVAASTSYTIISFSDPEVTNVVARMANERVLYVFDIDSTLLAFPRNQFVGSDHWYQWQSELPQESPRKIHCVFEMQAIAYRLQSMVATENGLSAGFVRALQDEGFDVIALTARGHDVRHATERELSRNGFDFSRSSPAGHPGLPTVYTPPQSPEVPSPRDASYQNGIGMLAGQSKGAMLGDLLERLNIGDLYNYIVFFDDSEKNVKAVMDWYDGQKVTALVFHYQGDAAKFPGQDIDETDKETAALIDAFAVFDSEARCLPKGR
jgi:hypothetical protein